METTLKKHNYIPKNHLSKNTTIIQQPIITVIGIKASLENKHDVKLEDIPIFNFQNIKKLEILGEGSFGIVFRAYQIATNSFLAIKYPKEINIDTFEAFKKEDHILKEVEKINKGKNYLKYDGMFRDVGNCILVIESGEINLKEILKVRNKYELVNAIHILHSLAKDLLFLEENGIASRDVKSENVILVQDQTDPKLFHYKISDFGIGCILPNSDKNLEIEYMSGFSPNYASPEVKEISKKNYKNPTYNPFKADVYSLGIVALQLLGIKKSAFLNSCQDSCLFSLISQMLDNDPETRIDFKGIVEELQIFLPEAEQPQDERKYILEFTKIKETKLNAVERVENLLTNYNGYRDISHFTKCQEIITLCNDIYEKSKPEIEGTTLELKIFRENAITLKDFKGNHREALKWETKYRELCLNFCGKLSEEFADANKLMAASLIKLGSFNEAETLYFSSYYIYGYIFGEEYAILAEILENLAFYYKDILNSLPKSKNCLKKAMNIKLKLFGKNHPETAKCFNNFGIFLCEAKQKDFVRAKKFFLNASEINEKILGTYHIETAITYSNLGFFYAISKKKVAEKGNNNFFKDFTKDWPLANQYFSKALKIADKIFGGESLELARIYENYAIYYQIAYSFEDGDKKKGGYKGCLECLTKALKIKEKVLGRNDIELAHTYFKIGKFYGVGLQKKGKGKPFFKLSWEIYEGLLGKDHKYTIRAREAFFKGMLRSKRFYLMEDDTSLYVVEDYEELDEEEYHNS